MQTEPVSDARVVFMTAPDEDVGRRIARALVEARLCACVNLLPGVRSVYRWQGQVEEALEVLLVIKTTALRVEEIERALPLLHPYELPELVAFEPAHVEPKYRAWLESECAP